MAAERRAEKHFGREHPFAWSRLAWRRRVGLNESQRASQPNDIEGKKFSEIGLGETDKAARLRSGRERRTAGLFITVMLVRVVRVIGIGG